VQRTEKGFKLYKEGELVYLQASVLAASGFVDHAFSTRRGGCSSGAFASLNTGFHVGDSRENVRQNRRIFFEKFNYDYRFIVSSNQVHGTNLKVFDQSNCGEGALPLTARAECDALVTAEPGLPLAAYSADCQLIYFASWQKKPVVALAHAGWRGTLSGIGGKVVCYLKEHFSAHPESIFVALGPAVCRNCYKIDHQAAAQFQSAGWDNSAYMDPAGKGEWNLDLSTINAEQLLQAGVREKNMARNYWCTSCYPELFYSYRREKGITGRMIGFISISTT